MKTGWIRWLMPIVVVAAAAGCTGQPGPLDGLPSDVDEEAVGKADSGEGVEIQPVSEALRSKTLRQMICGELGRQELWTSDETEACPADKEFTVTQVAASTRYLHADGHPVTMEMLVDVIDDGRHLSWGARLKRVLGSDFLLAWNAEMTSGSHTGDIHDYIRELAEDVGEYPDYHEDEFSDRVRLVPFNDLPEAFRAQVDQRLQDLNEQMSESEERSGAELADDQMGEILKDGEVVGYIISVYYHYDHPLFDGGGVIWYFDLQGRLVTDSEWWG